MKVYYQLGQAFISKRELKQETKMTIYKAVFCPVLTYGSETWTLECGEKSKLQATEMKFLRKIAGKTRRDKVRNTKIRESLNTKTLLERIEKNRLRWYGHVQRMKDERIPRLALMAKSGGKRPRGRPRKRWEQQVEEGLRERGLTLASAKKKCMERSIWRGVIQMNL